MKEILSRPITWAFVIPILLIISWLTAMLIWNNWMITLIAGTIAFWSCFLGGWYVSTYTQKEVNLNDRITPLDEYDEQPQLTTVNGFGTRLLGVTGNPYIKYQFFCAAFLPVFPLDCYAAASDDNGYRWIGTAEWNILEVIAIYMQWWGGIIGGIFTICTIIVIGKP